MKLSGLGHSHSNEEIIDFEVDAPNDISLEGTILSSLGSSDPKTQKLAIFSIANLSVLYLNLPRNPLERKATQSLFLGR